MQHGKPDVKVQPLEARLASRIGYSGYSSPSYANSWLNEEYVLLDKDETGEIVLASITDPNKEYVIPSKQQLISVLNTTLQAGSNGEFVTVNTDDNTPILGAFQLDSKTNQLKVLRDEKALKGAKVLLSAKPEVRIYRNKKIFDVTQDEKDGVELIEENDKQLVIPPTWSTYGSITRAIPHAVMIAGYVVRPSHSTVYGYLSVSSCSLTGQPAFNFVIPHAELKHNLLISEDGNHLMIEDTIYSRIHPHGLAYRTRKVDANSFAKRKFFRNGALIQPNRRSGIYWLNLSDPDSKDELIPGTAGKESIDFFQIKKTGELIYSKTEYTSSGKTITFVQNDYLNRIASVERTEEDIQHGMRDSLESIPKPVKQIIAAYASSFTDRTRDPMVLPFWASCLTLAPRSVYGDLHEVPALQRIREAHPEHFPSTEEIIRAVRGTAHAGEEKISSAEIDKVRAQLEKHHADALMYLATMPEAQPHLARRRVQLKLFDQPVVPVAQANGAAVSIANPKAFTSGATIETLDDPAEKNAVTGAAPDAKIGAQLKKG